MTPFEALAALLAAPGWQATTPTIEEIEAHAEAHPYGPAASAEEAASLTEDDPNTGGLWALCDAGGVGLVELYRGHRGTPYVMFAGALTLRCECDLASTVESERITGWLRLTADGRPVQ